MKKNFRGLMEDRYINFIRMVCSVRTLLDVPGAAFPELLKSPRFQSVRGFLPVSMSLD